MNGSGRVVVRVALPESFDFSDAASSDARAIALEGTSTQARVRRRGAFVRAVSEATSLSTRDVSWAVGAVIVCAMKNDAVPYAVVPGCDLLDHASSPNCVVRRRDDDKSSPSVVVETTRDVAAGERLTISYGRSLCNDRRCACTDFAPTNSSSTIPETFSFEDSGRFSASIRRTTRSRRACVKSPRAARGRRQRRMDRRTRGVVEIRGHRVGEKCRCRRLVDASRGRASSRSSGNHRRVRTRVQVDEDETL